MQNEDMVETVLLTLSDDIEKVKNYVIGEYGTIRAGRANPKILDKVMVNYYGVPTPVKQMANIAVPEARMITISVWDQSQLQNVSKAIQAADLGVNPSDDGHIIRMIFPMLTEEKRREIVKEVKKICEDGKVSMRNSRRDCLDYLKDMKKNGELSEDELSSLEKDVQKTLDAGVADLDKLSQDKEKEVMEL